MRWMYSCTSTVGASTSMEPCIQMLSRCRCRMGPSSEKLTSGKATVSFLAMGIYTSSAASRGKASQALRVVACARASRLMPRSSATRRQYGAVHPARCALAVHASQAVLRRSVKPVGRNIGRVGLQNNGVQRQRLHQTAQLQRALIGQGTTKTELETQFDKSAVPACHCR
jgi:hypothetical protein